MKVATDWCLPNYQNAQFLHCTPSLTKNLDHFSSVYRVIFWISLGYSYHRQQWMRHHIVSTKIFNLQMVSGNICNQFKWPRDFWSTYIRRLPVRTFVHNKHSVQADTSKHLFSQSFVPCFFLFSRLVGLAEGGGLAGGGGCQLIQC